MIYIELKLNRHFPIPFSLTPPKSILSHKNNIPPTTTQQSHHPKADDTSTIYLPTKNEKKKHKHKWHHTLAQSKRGAYNSLPSAQHLH